MNVLFLTHRLPYAPNRGDRIRAYYLLREMSHFADVSLFSLVHDDDEAGHAGKVPFANAVVTTRVSRRLNLARGSARLGSDRPLTHSLLDGAGIHETLSGLVAARRPDVVVAFCSGMARFAVQPPLNDFPLVLDMVDVDSAKWAQLAEGATGPRKWIYQREARTLAVFEAAAVGRASATLVVNERERDTLRGISPDGQILVVQNGIDVDAFRAPVSTVRSANVVFCGVLDYGPNESGVLWFMDAVWPIVRAACPDARFTIVGANPTRALRQAAAKDASVELVGAVASVQPSLWASGVSVAPLHQARGLQNKVLEALAAGLPVVLTPIVLEGLPEEARPGCLAAESPRDFARAVATLLNDTPAGRASIVAAARLSGLTWSDRLSDLERILREAAGGLMPDRQGRGRPSAATVSS